MSIISYGQHGEDCIMWEFFKQKSDGFFVDVGAFDGIYLSNSYAFEKLGWQGICVEPYPEYFERCQKNRQGTICINASCVGSDDIKETSFYTEPLGLFSGIDVNLKKVKDAYNYRDMQFEGMEEIRVAAYTLNQIFETHLESGTKIDFISIDVEGTELDVLQGLDFERFAPRLFVIEANDNDSLNLLIQFMANKGYHLARKLGVNYFFAATDDDIVSLSTIPVNCGKHAVPPPEEIALQQRLQKKPSIIKRGLMRLANFF